MEKLWHFIEENDLKDDYKLFDIIRKVIYEQTYTIGDLRPHFEKWSVKQLQLIRDNLAHEVTFEMEPEEPDVGERDYEAFNLRREAYISRMLAYDVWDKTKAKKKFF